MESLGYKPADFKKDPSGGSIMIIPTDNTNIEQKNVAVFFIQKNT